jgi:hypothetical protein
MKQQTPASVVVAVTLSALAGSALSVQLLPRPSEYAWLVFGSNAQLQVLLTVTGKTITLQQYDGEHPAGRMEQFTDANAPWRSRSRTRTA